MPSPALGLWKSDRAVCIDRLLAAHKHVRVTNSGRRWVTDELNHSLILRLASEFQGFARELHNDTSEAVVAALAPGDASLQATLLQPYQAGRRLDRGNADPDTLRQDFGLFGVNVWSALGQRYPSRAPRWHRQLRLLTTARNGLAHANEARIQQVVAEGWLLTLPFIHRWRIGLDGLASGMDDVIGHHVHRTLGVQPW
jgi:hypothetical protein